MQVAVPRRLRFPSRAGRTAGRCAAIAPSEGVVARFRAYFVSDASRTLQSALGLLWLVDGGLQFQHFMYSKGVVEMLAGNAAGQPGWLARAINW